MKAYTMSHMFNPQQAVTDLQLDEPANLNAEKKALLDIIRPLGISTVTAEYNGYGDEGSVETIAAVKADNADVDLMGHFTQPEGHHKPITLYDFLEQFVWLAVQHYHAGFHNNEGCSGTLTIDTATGMVKLEHNDNYVASEYSENEF